MKDTDEEFREEQKAEDSVAEMPGRRLREAREKAGMAQADVAAQLRISERMIAALEEDDYDVFPSATFVSGYLRSYARVLGLAESDVVKPLAGSSEPPTIVTTIGNDKQVSSRALPVRVVTYLLAGVIVASVVMWMYAQRSSSTAQSEAPAMSSEQGQALQPLVPADSAVVGSQADSGETTPDDALATSEPLLEQGMDTETQPVQDGDETRPGSNPGAIDDPDQRAITDTTTEAPQSIGTDTPVSRLELRYEADSWTEISDSAGRDLAYGLIKAGRTLKLQGEAPFRVFLGYAPGVEVYYNGELFEHAPFQRRDVARFRVGRAEHNLPASR